MRAQLDRDVTLTLVTSLMLSRLDYCNSVLAGLPASILAPLQRVLHAAARLVNGLRPHDHVSTVSPTLKELHWLAAADQATGRLQIVPPSAQSGGRPCAILPDWYADCSHRCPIAVYSPSCVQRRLCRPHGVGPIRYMSISVHRKFCSAISVHHKDVFGTPANNKNNDCMISNTIAWFKVSPAVKAYTNSSHTA